MDSHLGPSAFIVLGLIDRFGPATSYELKARADAAVGYFWSFPRSGLYAEPQRLTALGLLREEQETGGRRRRSYHLTDAGQQALKVWLRTPSEMAELRDPGLLKLYLSQPAAPQLSVLASEQQALHANREKEYERLLSEPDIAADQTARLTLRLGRRYAAICTEFWKEVEEEVRNLKS